MKKWKNIQQISINGNGKENTNMRKWTDLEMKRQRTVRSYQQNKLDKPTNNCNKGYEKLRKLWTKKLQTSSSVAP